MNKGTLFRNTKNKKRYYDDINERKIDGTEEIKQILNEEYLLKNNYDNDEEYCTELDFKNLKKETIYGDNEETTEQLNEKDLFNITNRRLINMITNKMKNEENEMETPGKVINRTHENYKKHKFMESEDESDSDLDYDVEQKPEENKRKKHFTENKDEELKEESYYESNSDLSSEDEKEEKTQENFQNEENKSGNEQLNKLEIKNSENSEEYDFREDRPPPEPPPDLPSTSGLSNPQKNVIDCRDQLTIKKVNYAYFITTNGEPHDKGAKLRKMQQTP